MKSLSRIMTSTDSDVTGLQKSCANTVRAFVIADLHAFDRGLLTTEESEPSFVDVSQPDTNPATHPIASLRDLIQSERLESDIVLCCGDLGDKAQPTAIRYAWKELADIKARLKAAHLAVTVGNHDVDSRHKHNEFDAKGFLQSLSPLFPCSDSVASDQFWARHYYVIEDEHYRVVVLNSSAFHGESAAERTHGRISPFTLERLKTFLASAKAKPINILLCHHHPHKHSELKLPNYSEMEGGPELLRLLEDQKEHRWLVIHGHTHHPKITYASGVSSNAPIVFSAGSLSARLYPELSNRARNQCYMLEFPLQSIFTFGLVGTFRAWEWNIGSGWAQTSKDSNIPSSGGFGLHTNLPTLTKKLLSVISCRMSWATVTQLVPEISFLLPYDLKALLSQAAAKGLKISYDDIGQAVEFER